MQDVNDESDGLATCFVFFSSIPRLLGRVFFVLHSPVPPHGSGRHVRDRGEGAHVDLRYALTLIQQASIGDSHMLRKQSKHSSWRTS